jgi:hypothetical protein
VLARGVEKIVVDIGEDAEAADRGEPLRAALAAGMPSRGRKL